jgi:hypothetical protein
MLGCGGVYGCDQLGRPLLFKMEFNCLPKHVRDRAASELPEYKREAKENDRRVMRDTAQLRWRKVDADAREREKWPSMKCSSMAAGVNSGKSNLDNVHLLREKMRNKASRKALGNQLESYKHSRSLASARDSLRETISSPSFGVPEPLFGNGLARRPSGVSSEEGSYTGDLEAAYDAIRTKTDARGHSDTRGRFELRNHCQLNSRKGLYGQQLLPRADFEDLLHSMYAVHLTDAQWAQVIARHGVSAEVQKEAAAKMAEVCA